MNLLFGNALNRLVMIVDFGTKHEPTTIPIPILSALAAVKRECLAILSKLWAIYSMSLKRSVI